MKVIGKMIKQMEKETTIMQMVLHSQDTGWMICKKGKVPRDGQMALLIQEVTEME